MTRSRRASASGPKRPDKQAPLPNLPAAREQTGAQLSRLPDAGAGGGPLWMPEGMELAFVPPEVRHAISRVVQPVYQRLVVESHDPLEKSLGVTVSHLLWLEILQQYHMKREYDLTAVLQVTNGHYSDIDQHIRILGAKVKVTQVLERLRRRRRRAGGSLPDADQITEDHGPDAERNDQ